MALEANIPINERLAPIKTSGRFATLDFARGLAIFLMIGLHTLQHTLNIDDLLADLNNLPLVNLVALGVIPFYGGLAGLFLIVSAISNMVSSYRDLERGNSVKSIVLKQVVGGVLLLIFAMLCEALIGYNGAFGNFFQFLDNPSEYFQYDPYLNYEKWGENLTYNWQVVLFRWNHFETIHTIAWCLIINGLVQGVLSLNNRWQNKKRLIIWYAILAVTVVALTQPVWELVKLIIPGYPFGLTEAGNALFTPVLGQDQWWRILTAPIFSALAAPMEPIFPYLAISFIGSIIGIVICNPPEKINRNFPRNMFLVGLGMFIPGIIGIGGVIFQVLTTQDFDTAAQLYQFIAHHRHWTPDYKPYIPMFSWLAQFLAVNGYAIMLVMFLFRLIEFRGKSKIFSDRSRFVRRFGTVAFSNYNNQWIFYIIFFFLSWAIYGVPYTKLFWGGTILAIIIALVIYTLLLIGWEKIKYIGSLEWVIRTVTNNLVPLRKQRFDASLKWWQKGQINVEQSFYNPEWIDLEKPEELKESNYEGFSAEQRDSKLALILSIVGLATIIFNAVSVFGLFVSINARKLEGKNKRNTAAFILSIIGCVLFVAFYAVCFSIKIGTLGIL